MVSKGLVRSKTDKLMLVRGGTGGEARALYAVGGSGALRRLGAGRDGAEGRTRRIRPGDDRLGAATEAAAERRAEARMKGYVGEACPECGNFTMVRNGTCLKCDTCGGTTGCS